MRRHSRPPPIISLPGATARLTVQAAAAPPAAVTAAQAGADDDEGNSPIIVVPPPATEPPEPPVAQWHDVTSLLWQVAAPGSYEDWETQRGQDHPDYLTQPYFDPADPAVLVLPPHAEMGAWESGTIIYLPDAESVQHAPVLPLEVLEPLFPGVLAIQKVSIEIEQTVPGCAGRVYLSPYIGVSGVFGEDEGTIRTAHFLLYEIDSFFGVYADPDIPDYPHSSTGWSDSGGGQDYVEGPHGSEVTFPVVHEYGTPFSVAQSGADHSYLSFRWNNYPAPGPVLDWTTEGYGTYGGGPAIPAGDLRVKLRFFGTYTPP